MKKIWNILIGLLLATALTLTVSAAGSSVSITPSAKTIHRGDTFTMVAYLSNTDAIKLGTVVLSYDDSILEMVGGTCRVDDAMVAQVIPAKKAGTFLLNKAAVVSGNIFTFTFQVKEDAAFGDFEIKAKAAIGTTGGKYIDATGTKITIACQHSLKEGWNTSKTEHWRVCSVCGVRTDIATHTPRATTGACTVCGYKGVNPPSEETLPQAITEATQMQGYSEQTRPQSETQATLPQDTTGTTVTQDPSGVTLPVEEQAPGDEVYPWWAVVATVAAIGFSMAGFAALKRRKKTHSG